MRAAFRTFAVSLLAFGVIRLWRDGNLAAYVHPSTIWMVATAGCVLALNALALTLRPSGHTHVTMAQVATVMALAILLTGAKAVPLSLSAAKERQTGAAPIGSRQGISLKGQTAAFTVLDWDAAWDSDPTHKRYLNTPATVTGFVTLDGTTPSVTRMLITCCAVDAQPVSLAFKPSGPIPAEGEWVRVSGTMGQKDGQPYLMASTVTPVPAPANQYVY